MTLAAAALHQFAQRRRYPVSDHEAALRPWAALALRAGADPAAISPDVAAACEEYRKGGLTEREARACVAADLCPHPVMLAELARARDAALNALPLAASAAPSSTAGLVVLAIHFGAPPYRPAPHERKAA